MPKPPAEDLFVLPDEYPPGPRSKRAVPTSRRNEELNVETLVVVDTQMLLKHGRDNVTTYVLTILNMVRGATRRHARRAVCAHARACTCFTLLSLLWIYVSHLEIVHL